MEMQNEATMSCEETDEIVVLGTISWSPSFPPDNYGELITDILEGYEGKVLTYDVISKERDLNGLLFVDKEITVGGRHRDL